MSFVRLAWDQNRESEHAGYKIHWGTTSRTYTFVQDVGDVNRATISGLADGTWYFATTAYDNDGNESEFSHEAKVILAPNVTNPDTPAGMRVIDTDGASSVVVSDEPQPPSDITPPVITNIIVTGLGETTATITWDTDEPADSTVRYATSSPASAGTVVSDATLVTSHSIPLSGLTDSTTYFYEVESADADSNVATSGEQSFTTSTPPAAGTEWDDDFETDFTAWGHPGVTSLAVGGGGALSISTEQAKTGTKSLKIDYPDSVDGRFMDRSVVPSTDIWTRFYLRATPGFVWSAVTTKILALNSFSTPTDEPTFWFVTLFGGNTVGFVAEANKDNSGGVNLFQNQGVDIGVSETAWQCYEANIKYNTPGQTNGTIRMWVDGVLRLEYLNREIVGVNPSDSPPSDSTITFYRVFKQQGLGSLYLDRIAHGTARIGCTV